MKEDRSSLFTDSAAAGIITALLAGPVFSWLLMGLVLLHDLNAASIERALKMLPVVSTFGLAFGLAGSAPAAIVNSVLLFVLARKHVDSLFVASASAATCGVLIAPLGLHVFLWKRHDGYWSGNSNIWFVSCLALTGALMGAIHWYIAIRPYRRWRTHFDRRANADIQAKGNRNT